MRASTTLRALILLVYSTSALAAGPGDLGKDLTEHLAGSSSGGGSSWSSWLDKLRPGTSGYQALRQEPVRPGFHPVNPEHIPVYRAPSPAAMTKGEQIQAARAAHDALITTVDGQRHFRSIPIPKMTQADKAEHDRLFQEGKGDVLWQQHLFYHSTAARQAEEAQRKSLALLDKHQREHGENRWKVKNPELNAAVTEQLRLDNMSYRHKEEADNLLKAKALGSSGEQRRFR